MSNDIIYDIGSAEDETNEFYHKWLDRKAEAEDLSRKLEEARGRIAELEAAIKPFVEHGVALGAFDGDDGPFRYYTDKGYREVKAEDFRNARSKLEGKLDA